MEPQTFNPSPGEEWEVKSATTIRLEVTDESSGLKVECVVLAGQSCKLTAGTSPVTIRVLDVEDRSVDGLQLVKAK